jgi:hypothetical protein
MVTTYNVNRVGLIQMPTQKLTTEILTAAIEGFEAQKRQIDEQIAQVRQILDGGRSEPAATPEVPRVERRKMSAAGRKRIAEAQRKRWAESKRTSQPAAPSEAPKRKKRKLSAAGRRAIAAATKKRWAAFHAGKEEKKPGLGKSGAAKKTARKAAKKTGAKRPVKNAAKAPESVAAQ